MSTWLSQDPTDSPATYTAPAMMENERPPAIQPEPGAQHDVDDQEQKELCLDQRIDATLEVPGRMKNQGRPLRKVCRDATAEVRGPKHEKQTRLRQLVLEAVLEDPRESRHRHHREKATPESRTCPWPCSEAAVIEDALNREGEVRARRDRRPDRESTDFYPHRFHGSGLRGVRGWACGLPEAERFGEADVRHD